MADGSSWVDDHPVDPEWPPPSPATEPESPSRGIAAWLPVGVPVLVGIVVIALVAAFGGFKTRTDRLIEVEAGSVIETGPFQLTFDKATIQQITDYGEDEPSQNVIVFGTGVNTWTQSLTPDADQFIASDQAGGEPKDAEGAHLSSWLDGPQSLAPELPPQSIEVEFVFSGDFDPGDKLRFGVSDLTYGDHSYLGVSSEKEWYNDGDRYVMDLPVERLPDEDRNDY